MQNHILKGFFPLLLTEHLLPSLLQLSFTYLTQLSLAYLLQLSLTPLPSWGYTIWLSS